MVAASGMGSAVEEDEALEDDDAAEDVDNGAVDAAGCRGTGRRKGAVTPRPAPVRTETELRVVGAKAKASQCVTSLETSMRDRHNADSRQQLYFMLVARLTTENWYAISWLDLKYLYYCRLHYNSLEQEHNQHLA